MESKQTYQEAVKAKLEKWDVTIQELEAQADEVEARARVRYGQLLTRLRDQHTNAQSRLQDLRRASQETWKDFQMGVEEALDDLDDLLDEVQRLASRQKG